MTVTGLNSDLYFSNNPIIITFSGINANTKYIEIFPSTSGPQNSNIRPQRLYVYGQNSITLDISTTVKLFYKDLEHNTDYTSVTPFVVMNNWTKITFIIKEVLNDGSTISVPPLTKTFVRGGNRTYNANQSTSINQFLSPINIFPQWGGYPVDYGYFNSNKVLTKSNILPNSNREFRKVKRCDPLYVKFLNSKGWYSYWLFESWETDEKNRNLGTVKDTFTLKDLGNDTETGITAISKVPRRFMPLMFDLADSQEIYIFKGNNVWERVTSDNNSVKQNTFNTNEKVKIKLNTVRRYNPSLVW